MRSILRVAAVIAFAGFLVACEATKPRQETSVDRVLMAPDVKNAPYSELLIVGASPSRETSRRIEEGLINELAKIRVRAHSFVKESTSTEATEQAIRELVDEKNIDGVVIVNLKQAGGEIMKHGERVDVDAEVRGGGLLDYFQYDYKQITDPGYSDYTIDMAMVTDFYDAESQKRVYSVQSSTVHGETTYEIVVEESRAIVERLKKDGLIR